MHLCYIDESGTSSIPGVSSHFILAGFCIPIWHWNKCDKEINSIKKKYHLENAEIHTAWILRKYYNQSKIIDFSKLSYFERRIQVTRLRKAYIYQLKNSNNNKLLRQTEKNYRKTDAYIHLTLKERQNFILKVADCISNMEYARLYAECIDKIFFDPSISPISIDEQAFEQIVSRFETYLMNINLSRPYEEKYYGMLIQDNNELIEKKYTTLMKKYQKEGTLWKKIKYIIETPLFVDSELTGMVQIADLCAYSLRRYLENGETQLFNLIYKRADKKDDVVVGVRHFSKKSCTCEICMTHNPKNF